MGQRLHLSTEIGTVLALLLAVALILLISEVASAHRPLISGTSARDPDSAVRIPDPTVSHVVYAELTPNDPHRWFVFDNDAPREVLMQIGIPIAVPQGDFTPLVTLFGPGWPDQSGETPFHPPQGEGFGTITLPIRKNDHHFYEPVTGTESHILVDTHVDLPEVGTYYGVVYGDRGPGGSSEGKVWVSIGQSEGFTWRDVARLPGWIGKIRQFHEVSGWPRWAWMGMLGLAAITFTVIAWVRRG